MRTYHKIENVFTRDPETHKLNLWDWRTPEFEVLQDVPWTATEKVDGMNMRILAQGEDVYIGGKTDNALIPGDLMQVMSALGTRMIEQSIHGLVLFGEGYGAGIQKGGAYSSTKQFALFDIQVEETGVFLQRRDVEEIAGLLGLVPAPILIDDRSLRDIVAIVADGRLLSNWGVGVTPEGVVARPKFELRSRTGSRIITKIKARDF